MAEVKTKIRKLSSMSGVSSFKDSDIIYGVQDNRTVRVPKSIFLAEDRRNLNQTKDVLDNLLGEYKDLNPNDLFKYIGVNYVYKDTFIELQGSITTFNTGVIGNVGGQDIPYQYAIKSYRWPNTPDEHKIVTDSSGVARKNSETGSSEYLGLDDAYWYVTAVYWRENDLAWNTGQLLLGNPRLISGITNIEVFSSLEVRIGKDRKDASSQETYEGIHVNYKNYYPSSRNVTKVDFIIQAYQSNKWLNGEMEQVVQAT